MEATDIVSRLKVVRGTIEQMMAIAGCVGLCYGVISEGEVIHVESIGYRDHARQLPVDENTMFPICSMTKNMISSALGILVDEGKLKWDDVVSDILPLYRPVSRRLRHSAMLADFLSMRSGVESYNMWTQSNNKIIFPKQTSMDILNHLRKATDLRAKFEYNNWGYKLAGHVIDHLTGEYYANLLHSRIFEPLGMSRTDATGDRQNFDNQAEAYMTLDDATPWHITSSDLSARTLSWALLVA